MVTVNLTLVEFFRLTGRLGRESCVGILNIRGVVGGDEVDLHNKQRTGPCLQVVLQPRESVKIDYKKGQQIHITETCAQTYCD